MVPQVGAIWLPFAVSRLPGNPTVSLLPCPTDTRGHLSHLRCLWASGYKPPLCSPLRPFTRTRNNSTSWSLEAALHPRGVRGTTCSLFTLEQRRPINRKLGFSFPPKYRRPRTVLEGSGLSHQLCLGITFDAHPTNLVGPPLGMPALSFHPHRGCPAKVPGPHRPPTLLTSSTSHPPQPHPFPEVA